MSTHATEGTGILNDTEMRSAQQASDLRATLKRHLMGLLDATMRETWLPMGFRVLVVQEFPTMRSLAEKGSKGDAALASYVEHLIEESEPYKTFARRSLALHALRALQADLLSARLAA